MIINISRSQFFQSCRRKEWFYDEGYVQLGVTMPLTTGGAYHAGAAVLTAKRSREEALKAAENFYRDALAKIKLILPEEQVLHERNIELVKRMINAQAVQYEKDVWTVLKPEVEGLVPLPGTYHHCWWCHNLLYPNETRMSNWLDNQPNMCKDPRCVQPHYLKFRTDAILLWNALVWIMERKTSGMKQSIFWDQWYLSHQLSGYVYGVRKTTNLPVSGVLLEKMPKPARNQDPFSFDYTPEREPYLRSEDDLVKFEREISAIATDFEAAQVRWKEGAHLDATFYRNPQSCINYNRRCDFWDCCKRPDGMPKPGEFRQRAKDYVELEYYKLLGLPIPEEVALSESNTQTVEEI